jgi:hypothetical protein
MQQYATWLLSKEEMQFAHATITTPNTSALTNCHVYCAIHKLILPKLESAIYLVKHW